MLSHGKGKFQSMDIMKKKKEEENSYLYTVKRTPERLKNLKIWFMINNTFWPYRSFYQLRECADSLD